MKSLLLIAQIVKISAGVAQLAFGAWVIRARTRSLLNVSLAIAFALNGIAYAVFNLMPAGQRTTTSFAVQGRAFVNWLAAVAMLVFITALLAKARQTVAFAVGALVAGLVLIADILSLREHGLSFWAFGGIATYPLTAFILGFLAVAFSRIGDDLRTFSVFLSAALAINSVDHLGAEVIAPSPTPSLAVFIQIGAMLLILMFWLARVVGSDDDIRRACLVAVACFVVPFVVALCVRVMAGSYRGFQQSGVVGVGRFAAVVVLRRAMR